MISRERRRDCPSRSDRSRAQSETLGFVLLFGLVVVAAGAIISFGVVAVDNSEESLSADRAEKILTQMDSEISMVALGRTNSQEIYFDRVPEEEFTIDEDSGKISIKQINTSENTTKKIMDNVTLGTLKFERGDTVVAYQGGGVWRTGGTGSYMVSPPEFNYRDQTLTLPLVTLSGERSLSNGAVVQKAGQSATYFPNKSLDTRNPLDEDTVQVTIESDYHDGWKSYFETRTEGEVKHEPENQIVRVNLTAPSLTGFDNGITATEIDEPKKGNFEDPNIVNEPKESASGTIEEEIAACEDPDNDCTDVSTLSGDIDSGRYYSDSDLTVESGTNFDITDGEIEIIANGSVDFEGKGGPGDTDQSIESEGADSDNRVTFYTKGDVDLSGNPAVNNNNEADPNNLLMLVHSDANTVGGGTPNFYGFIYAPNSEFSISGGGACGAGNPEKCNTNLYGGVVADVATGTGGAQIKAASSSILLEVSDGADVLTFLHISTNPVIVTGR